MLDNKTIKLIEATSETLEVSAYVVEKDFYVTKAIHALSHIKNENFQLIFQGGTCLSKAHRIVQRMSEDCDFRMQSNQAIKQLTNNALRNSLRAYRKQIHQSLEDTGFNVDEKNIQISNAGQFMRIKLEYETLYSPAKNMRPHLLLEFINVDTQSSILELPVTTLIKQTLGDEIDHPVRTIKCISILETAAEKWVAFTRRLASIERGYREFDGTLIRHLYDLHKIDQLNHLEPSFNDMVVKLILEDKERYKNQNPEFDSNPTQEIINVVNLLPSHSRWRQEWEYFTNTMVFNHELITYDDTVNIFVKCSNNLIEHMNKKSMLFR